LDRLDLAIAPPFSSQTYVKSAALWAYDFVRQERAGLCCCDRIKPLLSQSANCIRFETTSQKQVKPLLHCPRQWGRSTPSGHRFGGHAPTRNLFLRPGTSIRMPAGKEAPGLTSPREENLEAG